ncbi:hypothetical protein [Pseudomonas sp. Q1-7]|uniref:hypothetical protein n=1 Tax=Pseudomonas sp. Q1-7 TaxID=3020843 RepID=UPI002FE235BA
MTEHVLFLAALTTPAPTRPGNARPCDLSGWLRTLPAKLPLSLEIASWYLLGQGVGPRERVRMALGKARLPLSRH